MTYTAFDSVVDPLVLQEPKESIWFGIVLDFLISMQTRLPRVVLWLLITGLLVFYVAKQLNTPSTPIVQVRTAGPNQNFSGETLSGNSLSGALEDAVVPVVPNSPVANIIWSEWKEFVPVQWATSYSLSEWQIINRVWKKIGATHKWTIKPRQGVLQLKDWTLVAWWIIIDMNSITTSDEAWSELDVVLKGEDFFDTKNHETASFIVQEATNWTLVGVLTMKWISNQISVPATIITEDNQVIIRSEFAIDKAKRWINWWWSVMSKYIELAFTLRFVR